MITGLVVALPEELTTLTSKKIEKGGCLFITDRLLLAYSGAGPTNATVAAELLVAKGASRLISWGCAAALGASLKPGDLILADKLIDAENNEMAINADWHSYANHLLAKFVIVTPGCLGESVSIVSTSTDKKQLHFLTGAVALDMESIAIAKVAKQYTLPFLAIRVIVDPVEMNLPLAINHSLNDRGEVVLKKLLAFLFLHPGELPGLIKLGLNFNAAKKTLKSVAKHLDRLINFCGDE
ncbi:MAG: phosphorylase [Methylococcaceae bacterium]